ncbi:MAG TPA: response regulator [Gemmatimonadales bacterium]
MPARTSLPKVLFVEDEPSLHTSYERFFNGRYDMEFAHDGAAAARALSEFQPDVLVLDMRLPDTDGIALLQQIRASHPRLPVVVTTAYVSMEPLMEVLDLDHSAYLVKPFDLDDLGQRIDAAR